MGKCTRCLAPPADLPAALLVQRWPSWREAEAEEKTEARLKQCSKGSVRVAWPGNEQARPPQGVLGDISGLDAMWSYEARRNPRMAASLIKQIRWQAAMGWMVECGWQTGNPGALWDDITLPEEVWTEAETEVSRFGNNSTISSAARTRRFEAVSFRR